MKDLIQIFHGVNVGFKLEINKNKSDSITWHHLLEVRKSTKNFGNARKSNNNYSK
ncbi:hypothetical protein BH11BAC3_BH11BAC3_35660 [soil metagenome]